MQPSNEWITERPIEAFGEVRNIRQWSKHSICVVDYRTLWNRIARLGWPPEAALTVPKKRTGRKPRLMGWATERAR
jgi:hypothetical protein